MSSLFLLFVALWNFSHWVTVAAVAGVIISAIYGLRAAARVFFGPPTDVFAAVAANQPPADLSWSERLPALLLLALLLFIGFWPKSISAPLNATLQSVYAPPDALTHELARQ